MKLRLLGALAALTVTACSAATSDPPSGDDAGVVPPCGDGHLSDSERCDGGARPCAELGTSWQAGEAVCRADCSGYDLLGCVRADPLSDFEMVKPAVRDPERWSAARCNDGTPFGFDVRLSPSGSTVWVIWLEGGGLCVDGALPCSDRPVALTTTEAVADGARRSIGNTGVFTVDPTENPPFHDANHVYARYCSSDLWSGATAARRPSSGDLASGWYFSGRIHVAAMFYLLVARFGLDDGADTRVLFGGGSAGGHGAAATADIASAMLPGTAASGRMMLVIDAGWVADWDNAQHRLGTATVADREVMKVAYDAYAARLNPACEQAQIAAGEHPGTCLLSPIHYPHLVSAPPTGLGLPVLVQQNSVDPIYLRLHNFSSQSDPALLSWRTTLVQSLSEVAWVFSGTALEINGSPYHTLAKNVDWTYGPAGQTFREVLFRFWQGGQPERVIFVSP